MVKRGQLAYKALIEIIVSIIIIFAFIQAGKSFGNKEAHFKLAAARDIALTLDLAYSLPGDLDYVYPNDLSGFDVEIKENIVRVYNHNFGEKDPTSASYSYAGTHQNPDFLIENPKFLKITKERSTIRFEVIDGPNKFGGGGGGGAGTTRSYP